MTGNSLVVSPTESSPLAGTLLVESVSDLSTSLANGDWLAAGMAGASTALDTVATAMDPLGSLLGAGLGWLMEHLEPLKGWLNDLTGDPGAVGGFAGTWENIATRMSESAESLRTAVSSDLESLEGAAVTSYASFSDDVAAMLAALGGSSGAVAGALRTCATIVQVVHDLVRDALAQLVGSAISWAAQITFTLGLGTPWVISQVSTRVSSLAARVGSKVTALVTSVRNLRGVIDSLVALLRRTRGTLDDVTARPDAVAPTPRTDLPYSNPRRRPSYRQGVPEEVWDNARGPDGVVRDPNTGDVIDWTPGTPRRDVWDMGHVPGERYHDVWERYMRGEMTPAEFRDWFNDPANYRPELPGNNRGHRYE
ncbi:rhs protein [Beutenbergia cavernae DSM 12333]|uniref:Rhs protein n=1 Tax=Beutenbergia cavernae (strain ATCC BAA-8 / DSM 12333 / CCUG 43141 / JCM 11478 / NBRC 16432 / NCIMB 13614 / HKI 0122) TaxID=471853 RepID=C5BZG6_BEUC1|nr:HNH/ENDO VII family nuclease [Beutenbergia cavernae]ACQ79138.1 rhs protein [Beutenbergia cavernae DSM 12333]